MLANRRMVDVHVFDRIKTMLMLSTPAPHSDLTHRSKAVPRKSLVAAAQQERVRIALHCETTFIDSAQFRDPKSASRMNEIVEQLERSAGRQVPNSYAGLNQTIKVCGRGVTSLLTLVEERDFFLCLNYLKWRVNVLRTKIIPNDPQESLLAEVETLHRQTLVVRDHILSANLRLVMSIAKAQCDGLLTFDELFSEGVPVLFRAIDKFDVERGFRFSTYAYTAVLRSLHKSKADAANRNRRQRTSVDSSVLDRAEGNTAETDRLSESAVPIVRTLLERLPPRERKIVQARFGLLDDQSPCTLEEIGDLHGVSKERARQLLARAMTSLRTLIEESQFSDLRNFHEELPDA